MEVGDSIFFESKGQYRSARAIISQLGGKVTGRECVEDGKLGWRLWRIA